MRLHLSLRKVTYLLIAVALIIAGGVAVRVAQGHGATASPVSRTLACYLEGPESPDTPACQWAVSVGGTQPLYDWNEVSNMQAGGRHRELIPDGKLCSGNKAKYDAYNEPRLDWPTTVLQAGVFNFRYAAYVPHNLGYFETYITNNSYNPSLPLKWSDLEQIGRADEPPLVDGYYLWNATIPARNGRHIIYVIWQRNDSLEAFYSCSDVFFGVLPTPTPAPACTAPAWSASAIYNAGNIVSHAGFHWLAQWYVTGEEPGTTGEFGVWKKQAPCTGPGGNSTPVPTRTSAPPTNTMSVPTNTSVPPTATRVPTRTGTGPATTVATRTRTTTPVCQSSCAMTQTSTAATRSAAATQTMAAILTRTRTATRTGSAPPPTATRTSVPASATPVPTTGTGTLRLQYRAADTAASDNQIKPHFRIVNTGTTSVPLSELRIRYYFTKDNAANLVFSCDWAQLGCGNLSGGFAAASPVTATADTYLEISFIGTGSIAANGNSGEIQARINHSDWTNFNESNDWSFDPTKTAFADWTRVVLVRNGNIIWGTTS